MSWVRIDDKAWSHPKLAGLSGNAVRLWLFGLCWCNQQESDGCVPSAMLRVLGGAPKVAAELVAAGLWEATDDGWRFHDYLNYQPSREQLAAQRNATRERVTKHRERERNAVTPTVSNASETLPPIPTRPDPNQIQPPVGPPPGVPPARRERRQPADVPELMSPDWQPPAADVEAQATRWKASEDQVRRTVPEFREYWIREGKRKNAAGWLRAWTNRVAAVAKRGELWVDDLRQVQPRQGFQKPPGLVVHEQYGVPMSQERAAALVASVRRRQES